MTMTPEQLQRMVENVRRIKQLVLERRPALGIISRPEAGEELAETAIDESLDVVEGYVEASDARRTSEAQEEAASPECLAKTKDFDLDRAAEHLVSCRYGHSGAYYAQIPDELLVTKRDRPVSAEAKLLYALLHKHAAVKNLNQYPGVKVAKEVLAEEMHCSLDRIRIWINELIGEGWIGKLRRGRRLVNTYVLYPRSKRTWGAYMGMARVQLRLAREQSLNKLLRESIHHDSP